MCLTEFTAWATQVDRYKEERRFLILTLLYFGLTLLSAQGVLTLLSTVCGRERGQGPRNETPTPVVLCIFLSGKRQKKTDLSSGSPDLWVKGFSH